jgi:hypothetical protein
MGDLSLQESESQEIAELDTDHFPPTLVQVSLTCEARLVHRSCKLREFESDLSLDNVDDHEICCPDIVDPIYKPSSRTDSDGG